MTRGQVDLLQGTLELLVLKTLTLGQQHGYAIVQQIHDTTDDVLRIEEGSLYPALHRMEARGWIAAEWSVSENNRRAKFYCLTRTGHKKLREKQSNWLRLTQATQKVLALPSATSRIAPQGEGAKSKSSNPRARSRRSSGSSHRA